MFTEALLTRAEAREGYQIDGRIGKLHHRGGLMRLRPRGLELLMVFVLAASVIASQPAAPAPYRDASLPIDQRVRDLSSRMTLEEKFWQLFMIPGDLDDPSHDYSKGVFGLQVSTAPRRVEGENEVPARTAARSHAERINAIQRYFVEKTRLGIPIIVFDEAVHGLAREGATMFPQAIGLASTWDAALMGRVSNAIAREARARGVRQVLSPVVNIADDVRWGRVEETYGEDPFLVSAMGDAFVEAFERMAIVATPKHLVANVGEGGRDSYPIDRSERILTERFFPPFRTAIERAGARSVMTAYNSVDGMPATQNRRLLTDLLRGKWSFRGFVISDAAATGGATVLHLTEPNTPTAAKHAWEAGLDVVFQSSWPQHRPYLEAMQKGLVDRSIVDEAVARVLRVKFELGLFEQPYVDPADAERVSGHADHRLLARDAARASLVLLKNERQTLPMNSATSSVTVIGTDAVEGRLGGYSGPGFDKVTILDAIRQRTKVHYAPGPARLTREFVVIPSEFLGTTSNGQRSTGLTGEYFDNNRLEGTPRITRTDQQMDFRWTLNSPGRGIPFDWYSVRWTGTLTVPPAGVRRVAIEGNDGYRLYLDGRLAIDNWRKQSYARKIADVTLKPGSVVDIRLEYFESTGNARLKLMWDSGITDDGDEKIAEAVTLAGRSDVTVIVAGIEEGEFRDRALLSLPGRQEELIQRVAALGKRVIVVLVGGSAVTMSRWIDRVDAVLDAWYPGEQGGQAIADALFGDYNPAGRLPITFPMSEGQLPLHYNHKPTGRGDDYVDLTGQPLFPFGFGLSYTTFDYSALRIEPAQMASTDSAIVRCIVTNSGRIAGDEVVQLYIRDVLASMARPVMELKGFQRVRLAPGESREVRFTLDTSHLRMLDENMNWVVEPGVFRVMVGGSSKDIRLRGELVVK
jgi:beta-glucosidase